MLNVNFEAMNIKEQIEEILLIDFGGFDEYTVEKLLNLHSVSKSFYKVHYNTFGEEVLTSLIEAADEKTAKYLFYKQGNWTVNADILNIVNVC